ncbi:MAG TPA: DUF975 domain-containing protein [Kamptonema sp.]|nr:DUF975 domain-containing protein [Kamptonema sp.]
MPKNTNFSSASGPVSVGNVVSAGLRIYRDRFQLYYGLAFSAYAWILIPIYGWAKFSAISGQIARLAYCEVSETPETPSEARSYVEPRMWTFFWAGLLVSLIILGVTIGGGVVFGIVAVGIAAIVGQQATGVGILIAFLLGGVALIAFLFGYIWFFSRVSLVEMPIAIEDNITASSAISRSWELTKGLVGHLQLIYLVAFLISLPISIFINIISTVLQAILPLVLPKDSPVFSLVFLILNLGLTFASSALLVPFWQAIKAVIYYDIRSRKEGLDLQLRDADY